MEAQKMPEIWQLVKVKQDWLGFELNFSYGNYLGCWWLKNKTEHFLALLKNETTQITETLSKNFNDLPTELQVLLQALCTQDHVLYHKSIYLEHRGYLNVLVEKNQRIIHIDFFSKNFMYEKIIIKNFSQNKLNHCSEEFLRHILKSEGLCKSKNTISEFEILTKVHKLPELLNSHCSPTMESEQSSELALRTKTYAIALLKLVGSYKKSLFEKVTDYGLSQIAEYEPLRLHLLKFLAILPCLEHDQEGLEVKRLFLESLDLLRNEKKKKSSALPAVINLLLPLIILLSQIIPAFFLTTILRFMSRKMAQRFIAGETIQKSLPIIRQLNQTGRDATLDQLGELVLGEEEADHYKNKVLDIIYGLKKLYPNGERNPAGILRAHISIKTTALGSQLKSHAFEDCYKKISPRLTEILLAAKNANVFVNIDAEHYHFRDVVWKIYAHVLKTNKELYTWKDTGIVVQAYLVDAIRHVKEILEFQQERKILMPIRLVKGAYWDAETIEARAHHYDPPQFLNKIETDLHFRQLAYVFLANPYTQLVVASHNVLDHCYVESLRTTFFPQSPIIEHQCLHMTYEALSVSLVKMGFVVRNYMPVGNLLVGMAYLVRRIMENSSQVGVLKTMRSHQSINPDQDILHDWIKAQSQWVFSDLSVFNETIYENIAPVRLYLDQQWQHYEKVSQQMSNYQSIISTEKTPVEDISSTMALMHDAWSKNSWRKDSQWRCLVLMQAAELFNVFRDEISIVITQEAHKTILEAYADVDEAIDFINYYIDQFLFHHNNKFEPLGLVAAITPWNFPFAIPAGMAVAPLIAGNAVIIKSAEQTPQSAKVLVKLFHLAGVPKEIFQQVIGSGQTVGNAITQSLDLHGLVFTGSAAVGTMLYKSLFGKLVTNKLGQHFTRPVITEMGGKNAIIVTQNAELDETISGILYSSFAHAGQKCSACSRVIVDQKILPVFKKRLIASISSMKVGLASDPAVVINPVITSMDKKRLIEYKERAKEEALNVGGQVLIDKQNFYDQENLIGPLVILLPADKAKHVESYSHKEAFGPILHVIGYTDLTEAIEIANATSYALTAGVFAQSPADIQHCLEKLECGNIYVNRPNTGARVGIEPFGGFKLSGTGPKAGGRFYLGSFMHDSMNHATKENTHVVQPMGTLTLTSPQLIFPLPRLDFDTSLLQPSNNIQQLYKIIENKLVSLIVRLDENEKISIKKHFNFLFEQKLIQTEIPNVACPGQKSFSRWDLKKKLALLWQDQENIHYKDLLFLSTLLAKTIPLVVMTSNEKVKYQWEECLHELQLNGYPKNSIVIWYGQEDRMLLEVAKLKSLDLIHLACNEDKIYQHYLNSIIHALPYRYSIPQISSSYSSWLSESSENIAARFFHERAYAINVMRHGAPLEQ